MAWISKHRILFCHITNKVTPCTMTHPSGTWMHKIWAHYCTIKTVTLLLFLYVTILLSVSECSRVKQIPWRLYYSVIILLSVTIIVVFWPCGTLQIWLLLLLLKSLCFQKIQDIQKCWNDHQSSWSMEKLSCRTERKLTKPSRLSPKHAVMHLPNLHCYYHLNYLF